ncbi:LysR family transcriptional regulator [Calidifontibacter sp. DB0510]|uniref:LysR family transcriptional regulator n=1 Tax=Metallococcus carri TaxID=1656884 RepID=A0A967B230_9MICO|nr:LysR family transcriptional regulator [Metallococcus carri]NHN54207.1 LysR family transcriptional regulator [Metallococcus carri]NOP36953.1 LysR family transcriptional regulator [Calidifontibacter sp. DB2511S]
MTTWPEPVALELLVAVADHGSLGAAARVVGVAQPNASRSISRLERHLGTTLLVRSTSGSTLTGAGLLVVDWAREVLSAYARLRDGADALANTGAGRLTVAASQTVAEHLLPAWLTTLREQNPDIAVTVHVRNTAEVVQELLEGRCDLGFVEGPNAPTGVHTTVVARDELVLVAAPSHPWARRRSPVTRAELVETDLITREEGSGTRVALDIALGTPARSALEMPSNAAVRVAVSSGGAPAVLSRLAVADALASGALVQVPIADLHLARQLRAAWTGPRQLRGVAGDLVAIARRR